MLEFESVRIEYERSYKVPVEESQLDPAPRVNLENILELALINSRDYQTRKETLYRTAISLTLERFDYELRFFRRGNGTSIDYVHDRMAESKSIRSEFQPDWESTNRCTQPVS